MLIRFGPPNNFHLPTPLTVRRHKDGELMCIQPIKHRIKVISPDTGMGRDCPPCSGHDSEHKRFRLPGRHVFCQRSGPLKLVSACEVYMAWSTTEAAK